MKKWIKWIAVSVIGLVVAVIVIVYFSLNSIIRAEIEKQATASLNVPTTLGSFNLSLFGGTAGLSDLDIGSPAGYSAPHMLTLGGADVAVDYSELRGNPIHIKKITIDAPVLVIEQKDLKLNIQALSDTKSATPQTSSGEAKPPMKVIIDELDVTNAKVEFLPGLPGLSGETDVTVPSVTLKNIGNADGNGNGAAIKDVVMQTINAEADSAKNLGHLPGELIGLLTSGVGNATQQLTGQVNQQIQNLTGGNSSTTQPSNTVQNFMNGLGKKN